MFLDTGTNNVELREHPYYYGVPMEKLDDEEYVGKCRGGFESISGVTIFCLIFP